MRILFLTDSLSLPRLNTEEQVDLEDTYIEKLRARFPEFTITDSAIGGATIVDLYKQVFYYKSVRPDIVILQSGIVDCAPRAYKKFGKKVLSKLGLINKLTGLTRWLRKYRGYTLTSPTKFTYYLNKIKSEFPNSDFYTLGILSASDDYEKKVPNIKRNVNRYNHLLKVNSKFIDNTDIPFDAIMSDHHHLNQKGHQLIFNKLEDLLNSVNQS